VLGQKKTFWHRSKQHINEIQSLDGDAQTNRIDSWGACWFDRLLLLYALVH